MSVRRSLVLTDYYNYANRKFWRNKLPRNTFVYWNRHCLPREGSLGMAWTGDEKDCVKVKVGGRYETIPGPNIAIAWELRLSRKMLKLVLLHEMMHLRFRLTGGEPNHGKRFDRELRRILKFKEVRNLL